MQTNIRKIGNSAGAIIPAALLKKLNLSQGDTITIEENGGKIVISNAKPVYQLKDLIAKCDLSAPMPTALQEWDAVEAVGNEKW
tara:strand:- start:19032 stop:19283 length:252 start_codon:yes stop_codon:yes gene_type:complete